MSAEEASSVDGDASATLPGVRLARARLDLLAALGAALVAAGCAVSLAFLDDAGARGIMIGIAGSALTMAAGAAARWKGKIG